MQIREATCKWVGYSLWNKWDQTTHAGKIIHMCVSYMYICVYTYIKLFICVYYIYVYMCVCTCIYIYLHADMTYEEEMLGNYS